MKQVRRAVLVVLTLLVVFAVSASEASGQLPTEDSVSGTGATQPGPLNSVTDIVVDLRSDPGGANPSGTVSFTIVSRIAVTATGPVTCLGVDGNRAQIGFVDIGSEFSIGPIYVEIVDNESTGLPDTFFVRPGFTDCVTAPPPFLFPTGGPVRDGDFVVREAVTTKHQCTNRGWRGYTDEQGQPFFNNQGDCIQFAKHPA
jgi:hypothetical protein